MLVMDVIMIVVVMMVMMMAVIMVVMVVAVMMRNHGQRGRRARRLQRAKQATALGPDQPGAERRDQRVAAISMSFSAPHIVLAVALSSPAQTATMATATSDCISAEANDSAMPRRAVSWLATR